MLRLRPDPVTMIVSTTATSTNSLATKSSVCLLPPHPPRLALSLYVPPRLIPIPFPVCFNTRMQCNAHSHPSSSWLRLRTSDQAGGDDTIARRGLRVSGVGTRGMEWIELDRVERGSARQCSSCACAAAHAYRIFCAATREGREEGGGSEDLRLSFVRGLNAIRYNTNSQVLDRRLSSTLLHSSRQANVQSADTSHFTPDTSAKHAHRTPGRRRPPPSSLLLLLFLLLLRTGSGDQARPGPGPPPR